MLDITAAIIEFDKALRVIAGVTAASRPNPGRAITDAELSPQQRRHSAGLMRVNHVGEVCAQALYQSQSRRAKSPQVVSQFIDAGREEQDHLGWTGERLKELGARPSLLNPLWYGASFGLGTLAAALGDATSLGFMVETERQVEAHLASHLDRLPSEDRSSRAIVEQMRQDEARHGLHAQTLGAAEMPELVKLAMRTMAKAMTTVSYYV